MAASESEDISTPGDSGDTGLGLVPGMYNSWVLPWCDDTGDGSLGVLRNDLTESDSDMVVPDLNDIPKKTLHLTKQGQKGNRALALSFNNAEFSTTPT